MNALLFKSEVLAKHSARRVSGGKADAARGKVPYPKTRYKPAKLAHPSGKNAFGVKWPGGDQES